MSLLGVECKSAPALDPNGSELIRADPGSKEASLAVSLQPDELFMIVNWNYGRMLGLVASSAPTPESSQMERVSESWWDDSHSLPSLLIILIHGQITITHAPRQATSQTNEWMASIQLETILKASLLCILLFYFVLFVAERTRVDISLVLEW